MELSDARLLKETEVVKIVGTAQVVEQDVTRLKVNCNEESVKIQTKSKEKMIENPADEKLSHSRFETICSKMFNDLSVLPENIIGGVDKSKVVVQRIYNVLVKAGCNVNNIVTQKSSSRKFRFKSEAFDDHLNEAVPKEIMKAFVLDNEVAEAKTRESGQVVENNLGNESDSLADEFIDNDIWSSLISRSILRSHYVACVGVCFDWSDVSI